MNWRLYVDIGHFAVKFGLRAEGEWVALDALQHGFGCAEDEAEAEEEINELLEELQGAVEEAELSPSLCSGIFVCSGVWEAEPFLARLARLFPCELRPMGAASLPVFESLYRAGELGDDRLANVLAARELYPLPAIVIDAGTCVTSEVIAADGCFLGGNIAAGMPIISYGIMGLSPGLRTAMESAPEEEPDTPIGRNTAHAVYGGIALQLAGTAGRFVEAALTELGAEAADVTLVITGGDAEVVHNLLGYEAVLNPTLTLEGLRIADGFE